MLVLSCEIFFQICVAFSEYMNFAQNSYKKYKTWPILTFFFMKRPPRRTYIKIYKDFGRNSSTPKSKPLPVTVQLQKKRVAKYKNQWTSYLLVLNLQNVLHFHNCHIYKNTYYLCGYYKFRI